VIAAGLLGLAMQISAQAPPPQILQIYRDFVKPGSEAEYGRVEEDAARICAELNAPNAYLAIESLTGAKEVWFFNGYGSRAAIKQIGDAYAKNAPLMAALEGISQRKADMIGKPIDIFTDYRPDSTRGEPWNMSQGRFLAILIMEGSLKGSLGMDGTVFEAEDGTAFVIQPARTREEAEAKAAAAGAGARVFAVRPEWSKPAKEWVAADPEFWERAR
jgi:hypothetical protein